MLPLGFGERDAAIFGEEVERRIHERGSLFDLPTFVLEKGRKYWLWEEGWGLWLLDKESEARVSARYKVLSYQVFGHIVGEKEVERLALLFDRSENKRVYLTGDVGTFALPKSKTYLLPREGKPVLELKFYVPYKAK